MDKKYQDVVQVDETCWEIRDSYDGKFYVNCYLFIGKDKAMLVDSGFGAGDIKAVVDGLTDLPVMLVNTHADGDHIMGNKNFGTAHMHPSEYDRYHSTAGQEAPVAPLWEGDVIDIGGRRFEVILIPGHTPGSIALLDAENRILVCGDSVQDGMIFMIGAGRNMTGFIESIGKLKKISDRFDKVYCGHGDVVEGSALLDDLIDGAQKVLRGEVKGKPMPDMIENMKASLYTAGRAKFLFP